MIFFFFFEKEMSLFIVINEMRLMLKVDTNEIESPRDKEFKIQIHGLTKRGPRV